MKDEMFSEIEMLVRKGKNVTKKDLLSIRAIAENPVSERLIKIYTFTKNEKTTIDFKKLLFDLYEFVNGKNVDLKIMFLFKLYDKDGDGYITNKELFKIIKEVCNDKLADYDIQQIVDQTFSECRSKTIDLMQFKNLIYKRNKNVEKMFLQNKRF